MKPSEEIEQIQGELETEFLKSHYGDCKPGEVGHGVYGLNAAEQAYFCMQAIKIYLDRKAEESPEESYEPDLSVQPPEYETLTEGYDPPDIHADPHE